MALLRNYVRQWTTRSVRQFSTEFHSADNVIREANKSVWIPPRLQRLKGNLPLNDRLRANEPINHEGWINIRKELMASPDLKITESTVDMTIVHLCLDNKKIETALEYLQYLWDSESEMKISPMMTYLKLCYSVESNKVQFNYLLNIYNKIREKYPVMDAQTAECCILAISKTNRWKESFELLDMIKLSSQPRSVPYSAIITAAFNNNESEIGWKYLNELLTRLNPNHHVYIAYLKYCTRNFKGEQLWEEISKMFKFWRDLDLRPYVEVISEYEKVFKANGWSVERTSISKLGVCSNCSHTLSPLYVKPEDYKKLTDTVHKRIIVGDDVYRKTSPEELRKFLKFIKQVKPYNIVIDGLNVSYCIKTKFKPDGTQISNVVNMCVRMGKTVLVLGRKHMLKWKKLDINYINKHGSIFLAENSTADDPFVLYATLNNGPDTLFISNDFMRQHKYLIEDSELAKIFKYWQMAHQMYPSLQSTNKGLQVHLKNPPKYVPLAQMDDNGWHVPVTNESSLQPPLFYEPPKDWVCFRKHPPSPSGGVKLT